MTDQAVQLLQRLIAIPSLSRQEDKAADAIEAHLREKGVECHRFRNNLWALSDNYDPQKPTLMLNSHIDTVKPSASYTFDPFAPFIADGKIYGLGSNDAGASVVSLITAFCAMRGEDLAVNLLLAISAEEEVMGVDGMRALLPHLKEQGISIDMAVVGEPTGMQPAVAERGLMVLDCVAHGVSGHAARNEGVNAIYKAMEDIDTLRNLQFPKVSEMLGPIKITVTQIEAGYQHNAVPDTCKFVADVRTTDAYTNIETLELIRAAVKSDVKERSTRIQASAISLSHPLVKAAIAFGGEPYVSPTTSDMAAMPDFPSLKLGPGQSSRSHTADEYVLISEIDDAIKKYILLLKSL